MKHPEVRIGSLPPIRISAGTLVTVAVLAILVHPAAARVPGIGPGGAAAVSIGVGVFMIVSVAIHELAHTLAALRFGAGVDHIALTLWGGHTQYSGGRLRSWHSIVISLVGPASNAVIGAAASLALPLAEDGSALAVFLFFASRLNYALALFNLLPGLPMDGGRAVEGVIGLLTKDPAVGTRVTAWIGRGIAVLVVALALARVASSSGSVDVLLLVWALLIAGMLWQGASSALQGARLDSRVRQADLQRFLRPAVVLPAGASVQDVRRRTESSADVGVLVGDPAIGLSLVDLRAVAAVPLEQVAVTPASAVSTPIPPSARLRLPQSGTALISAMLARPFAVYVVEDALGQVVGTVTSADVNVHLRNG